MKYRTIDGGYKVPVFTKRWKLARFLLGTAFGFLAVFATTFFYKYAFPNIPTVRRIAYRYTICGFFVHLVILCFFPSPSILPFKDKWHSIGTENLPPRNENPKSLGFIAGAFFSSDDQLYSQKRIDIMLAI